MKSYTININTGDIVELGRFRNVIAKIKDIKTDEHGQPVIVTNRGEKKLFSCRLSKLMPGTKISKKILQEKK
jgi:hypothetical protein